MHSDYRGMAFLLSLGALPIACTSGDSDDATAGTTATTGNTSAPVTTGASTTDATTTTGNTDPTSTTASTTPTTTASSNPTADPTPGTATESTSPTESTTFLTTDSDAGTTQEATEGLPSTDDATCLAYAAKLIECFPRYADYRQMTADYCAYYKMSGLSSDGQACLDALEAQFVCLSKLDCADFENEPCPTESAAAEAACPSLNSIDTDTGGFGDTGSSG